MADLKNEDDPINGDDQKNEENPKNEDDLKMKTTSKWRQPKK